MKFVCFLGVVLVAFCAQHVEALSKEFLKNMLESGLDSTQIQALSMRDDFPSFSEFLGGSDSNQDLKCDRKGSTTVNWKDVLETEQCDFEDNGELTKQCTKEREDAKEAIVNCLMEMKDKKVREELACNIDATTEFVGVQVAKSRDCWWTSRRSERGLKGNGFKDVFTRLIPVNLRNCIKDSDFPNYKEKDQAAALCALRQVCGIQDNPEWDAAVAAKLVDEVELTKVFLDMLIDDYIEMDKKDKKDWEEKLTAKGINADKRTNRWTLLGKTIKKDPGSALMQACVSKDVTKDGNKRDVYKKLIKWAEKLGGLKCKKGNKEPVVAASYVASAPEQQVAVGAGAPGQNNGGGIGPPASGGQMNGFPGAPSFPGQGGNRAPMWKK